jgi:hypothetical protein
MLYHHFIDTIFVVVVVKKTKKFPFLALSFSIFELKEQKCKIRLLLLLLCVCVFCAAKRYISTINKLLKKKQTNAIYIACLVNIFRRI